MKLIVVALAVFSAQAMALTFTTEEYPPLNYSFDEGQKIAGYATDLVREMLGRTGIDATITVFPWKRAYQMALVNRETCVYSTTRTEARENLFKWVGPVATDHWVVFAKAGSKIKITTLDDLKKLKVAAYQGDAKAIFLKSKGITPDEAVNEKLNARKLEAGRVDAWVSGSASGPWVARDQGIKIKPIFAIQEVHMYLACNPAVSDNEIAIMNEAIKAIKADGTYDKFLKSYTLEQ